MTGTSLLQGVRTISAFSSFHRSVSHSQDFTEGYEGFSALQVVAFLLQMEKTQSVLAECLALI